MDSDDPFDIFKLFLKKTKGWIKNVQSREKQNRYNATENNKTLSNMDTYKKKLLWS